MNTKKEMISDEKIEELYNKLRPVVTVNGAKYLLKKFTLEEIKKEAYLTNKKINKNEYLDNSELSETPRISEKNHVAKVLTYKIHKK